MCQNKKMFCRSLIISLSVVVIACAISQNAYATMMEQMLLCPKASALANTCTADPPGVYSVHYNPAGLTTSVPDGKYVVQGVMLPYVDAKKTLTPTAEENFGGFIGGWGPNATEEGKKDPLANTEGSPGGIMYIPILNETIPFMIAPLSGLTIREPDSNWTFALGSYPPFAGGFTHTDDDDPFRFDGKVTLIQHMNYLAPSASYRVNDQLSVGLSIGIGQTVMIAETDNRSPNDLIALTKVLGEATEGLEIPILTTMTLPAPWFGGGIGPYDNAATFAMVIRDDFSPSYNLGALWSPNSWLSLGLTYQSEIVSEMTGRYSWQLSPEMSSMMDWFGYGVMLPVTAAMLGLSTNGNDQYGYCTVRQRFPQRLQAGIKLQPVDSFKFLFDVHWADWSIWKGQRVIFDQEISLIKFLRLSGYKHPVNEMRYDQPLNDTIHWSTAIEIIPNDKFTFRLGYEFRPSSMPKEYYDAVAGLPDMHNIGTGLGINLDNGVVVDLSMTYMYSDVVKIPHNTSSLLNSSDWTKPVKSPFVGLDYTHEMKFYAIGVGVTLPLEMMVEHTKGQIDAVKKMLNKLNPMGWFGSH